MKGCFQTNISQDEISSLVKSQLENMSSWTVKSNALTGTGSYGSTYSMGSQKLYIMIPNSTSIQNAKQQIKSVMDKVLGVASPCLVHTTLIPFASRNNLLACAAFK